MPTTLPASVKEASPVTEAPPVTAPAVAAVAPGIEATVRKAAGLFDLTGKTAVVSGARTGIGQAVAIGLARAGADVILLAGREEASETEQAVRRLDRYGGTVHVDLSCPAGLAAGCQRIFGDHQVDILFNNAGMVCRKPAVDQSWRDWRDVLAVNLDAVWALCQGAGRQMVDRRYGKIINVASVRAFTGGVRGPAYTASKHAVVGLTRTLAAEWGPYGIQVNAIAPGYTITSMTQAHHEDDAKRQAIENRIPAGRWGEPLDFVGPAVFLASDAANYVNGHTLTVDGGYLSL